MGFGVTFHPKKRFYFYWSMFLTLAFFYNYMFVFMRTADSNLQGKDPSPIWSGMNYFADAVYVADAVIRSRLLVFSNERNLITRDAQKLRTRYLCSSTFIWDVLAVVPIEFLPFAKTVGMTHLFRMNRFLKFWRVMEFVEHPTIWANIPNAFRLIAVMITTLIVHEWNPDMSITVSQYLGLASGEWVHGYSELSVNGFQPCLYLPLRALLTTGYFIEPENPEEVCYFIVHILAGVVMFAAIFPLISTILNNMKQSRNTRNLEHVVGHTSTFQSALDEHFAILRKASIFRDCNPGLFLKLVLKLRYSGIYPSRYLCKKGDIGKEMYILQEGVLEVVSDDGLTVFATLTKGAVFCELSSILNNAGITCGSRRTVNVRSVGYSHVFSLKKRDLWDALKDYPEAKDILLERGDISQ